MTRKTGEIAKDLPSIPTGVTVAEPLRVAEIVRAVALLLGTVGVAVTEDVQQAVVAVIGGLFIVGSFLVTEWQRRQVYAADTAQKLVNRAAVTGDTDIGKPPDGGF